MNHLDLLINALTTILVTIDPPGLAPIFLSLTVGMNRHDRYLVARRGTLIALSEHLQCGIFDVGNPAQVKRNHPRLMFGDQRPNIGGDLLGIDKEQAALGTHDQQAGKGFVIGVFWRQRAQHVGDRRLQAGEFDALPAEAGRCFDQPALDQ